MTVPSSQLRVEKVLKSSGCALVWISHDPEQPTRVGGKVLELPGGMIHDLPLVLDDSYEHNDSKAEETVLEFNSVTV